MAHSPCLSGDSRHSYSVGLLIRLCSHDCSCPLAPRKSFDILALYKSDYYYYYYTMQALVWQRNARENQNFTVTNVSSIPLCISYYADNDDKDNPNITCGLSCTWQTPNCTTADRIFLLCESEKQTSMAENSFNCFWCARCTKMLSKCDFKHANCLLSLTTCQGIPASVPSSISWVNARYEATTVGREMWIT